MRRVCVTGGAGFIGGYVIDALLQRPEIEYVLNVDALTYAASKDLIIQHQQDVRYQWEQCRLEHSQGLLTQLLREQRIDTILHLAAESHVDRSILDPKPFIESNILGTYALLEAARTSATLKKFIHVSTDEVYGSLVPGQAPFTEKSSYCPSSPYSASKASSDHLVTAYTHTYQLPAIITHCTNNFGPRQYPEKLIPKVMAAILAEQPIPIYGTGENIRDWLYVSDHVQALFTIVEKGTDPVYTISAGQQKSNLWVIETLCDLMDQPLGRPQGYSRGLMRFVTDRPGHDFAYGLAAAPLRALGWQPTYSVEQGLKAMVTAYLQEQALCTSQ